MIKQNESNKEIWRSLALYGFSSLNLGITILGGYYIGSLLEKSYHWKNISMFGVFAGLVLGLMEIFIVAFKAGQKK